MKEVLSLLAFSLVALCFVTFFAVLKPIAVTTATGTSSPRQCDSAASHLPVCRPQVLAARWWPDVMQR
jgi:hypothetical protein